jgi:hypothetical protein
MTTTCTVVIRADGTRCGREAVHTFGSGDETFAECERHHHEWDAVRTSPHAIGDRVEVRRYGKTYIATVVEVGARGAVYAEFTYGNGARRKVRV